MIAISMISLNCLARVGEAVATTMRLIRTPVIRKLRAGIPRRSVSPKIFGKSPSFAAAAADWLIVASSAELFPFNPGHIKRTEHV